MASEALRQISGVESGYCLENITARSALILDDTGPNEIFTALRSCQTSGPSATKSWSFTISSRSRSSWVVNCEGLVRLGRKTKADSPRRNPCLRNLQPSKWYESLAEVGVHCGPAFQGLNSITCSTTTNLAKAKILNLGKEHGFLLHPSAVDACLQLLLVAWARGLCRNFTSLTMTTLIEELEISQGTSEMEATVWSPDENGSIGIQCVTDGTVVLRLSGLHVTSIDEKEETESTNTSVQLETSIALWRVIRWTFSFSLARCFRPWSIQVRRITPLRMPSSKVFAVTGTALAFLLLS